MVVYRRLKRNKDYKVGTDGSVWSIKSGKWRQLKPFRINKQGHLAVDLGNGTRKHRTVVLVSHLVLEEFVGPKPKGAESCHFPDRNPANNNICNLRWDSHSANEQDKKHHGTFNNRGYRNKGEKHHQAKLTQKLANRMRKMYKTGEFSQRDLADIFDVSQRTVLDVVNWRRWDGKSHGTKHIIGEAKKNGLRVIVVRFKPVINKKASVKGKSIPLVKVRIID